MDIARLALLLVPALFMAPLAAPVASADTLKSAPERISATADTAAGKGLLATVSLDADDAFLPKILAILAELSGYNVVAGPEVNNRQRISIHLKNTPIEEAVNLVVRAAGLSYEIVGNSFLVTNQENLKNEVGVVSNLIELKYARAAEVKNLLKDITVNVQVDTAHNTLLVTSSPKAISEIRKVVEKIDIPSRQIMLQTRLIEVSIDKLTRLGVDWERLSKLTTILAESPADITSGGRAPTKEELGSFELGHLPTEHIYQRIKETDDVGYFSRQLTAFDITIDWLLKRNFVRILTDAKLTAMNNRKAVIHIGEIIPFLVQSQQTAQVERDSIGIKVELTPQVNAQGDITLTVKPAVSNFVELIANTIPRKKIRMAETTVLVKDRQKIVIGGLLNEEEKTLVHKIPFFGDLIFFGKFFQHLEKTQVKTDLIIEITPFILNNADSIINAGALDTLLDIRDSLERAMEGYQKDSAVPPLIRLCLMPTTQVLKPFQYSFGIHEIAVGQFNNMQVSFSPYQTAGKLRVALKYQWRPSLAFGFGYRWGQSPGEDPFYTGRQFGAYAVHALVRKPVFGWYLAAHGHLGHAENLGGGTGWALNLGSYVSLLGETTWSFRDGAPGYWTQWTSGALNVRWPYFPHLSGALGVKWTGHNRGGADPLDLDLFIDAKPGDKIYFDLAYSGVF